MTIHCLKGKLNLNKYKNKSGSNRRLRARMCQPAVGLPTAWRQTEVNDHLPNGQHASAVRGFLDQNYHCKSAASQCCVTTDFISI